MRGVIRYSMYEALLRLCELRNYSFYIYVQIYRNLRRNPKCAFENFFSSTPSGPGFSHCL